jgi:hypothetical protein
MTTTDAEISSATTPKRSGGALFASLIGLAGLVIVLQGLWAGIFLEHDGSRDNAGSWIDIHARGADVAIVLALAAAVVAFLRTRARRDLWIGSAALVVVLILEAYLGGLIRDDGRDTLTAVHVPLGMALVALVAWLSARSARRV